MDDEPIRPCPRILLVGAGRFGIEHLKEWIQLSAEGEAALAGIVVRTPESARRLEDTYDVPVHIGLRAQILSGIDGVDIVTPVESHFPLVKACLQVTNVLVEKPLAWNPALSSELGRLAKQHRRLLMVGHVYRFHPVIQALRKAIAEAGTKPRLISGRFSNPYDASVDGLDPRLEFLHLFDIIDLLFDVSPEFCLTVRNSHLETVSLRYPGSMNAVLELGWAGERKQRDLSLLFEDRRIDCDFSTNTIVVRRRDELSRTCIEGGLILRSELRAFARLVRGVEHDERVTGAETAARIVDVAVRKVPFSRSSRPRVAVIGAGVFGATCAIELGEFCDVTLFERHSEIMTEASFLNQWRHHAGFHYPRSPKTVQEVKCSRDDFMERYRAVVLNDFPSYYCTSSRAREITAERYLAVCTSNELNFESVTPPADALAPGSVSLCLKTDEGILDFHRLKRMIELELAGRKSVRVRMGTEVVGGSFGNDGSKRLEFRGPDGTHAEAYDFVVNTTYANRNLMANWFQFPMRPLRFDLLELLVLELDLAKVSVTVLDGPFTSLTTMGHDNLFMLSHIEHSVLKSIVTRDGAPPQWGEFTSNRSNLMREGARYFPAVAAGRIVESRYGVRAVYAYSEDFDGRPTVVTEHGFGCWSVLGGKVITCVRNARDIADSIRLATDTGNAVPASRMHDERIRDRDTATNS